jgi:hemerythrin superfamily protein
MSIKDAVALLKHDHETVKTLFEQVKKLSKRDSDKKERVFGEIKAALEVHATIEEEIFYPAVKKARSEHVKDEVREAYEEHKKIKRLLTKLSKMTASDESFDMEVEELKEAVEHHVKEEEGEMFGDAKKYLGEPRLLKLGEELEARKAQLEKRPAPKSSSSSRHASH